MVVGPNWSRKSVKLRVIGLGREIEEEDVEEFEDEFSRGKKEEINYDKDPEFADILGDCLDNPDKAQKKVKSLSFIFILLVFDFICILEIIDCFGRWKRD